MIDSVKPPTAKAKLALSRAQLLNAMGYEELNDKAGGFRKQAKEPGPAGAARASAMSQRISQSVVGSWWRRSHLSSAVELAEPFLQSYARRHPAKLIAYGAGTGALLWVVKPWRLLSIATVVSLVLKSSNFPGMVVDMVGRMQEPASDTLPPVPGSAR